jgi:hypothetical protein
MNIYFDLLWGILLLGVFRAFRRFLFEKHLLGLLLRLELVLIMIFRLLLVGGEVYISLVYMTMGVCEGAIGISLLIVISRSFGGRYLARYRLRRC